MQIEKLWRRNRIAFILLLGLLQGLIYLFLVPPWQHYDEPTHFEYAWLIANRPGLPQVGDFDQTMRRQVAVSMLAHGFFNGMDFRPNLDVVSEPIWIGFSQLYHPPLYYVLASIPLRFFKQNDVTVQLYSARLVSLVLYLLLVATAYGLVREITPADHPLQVVLPLTLVLLPGFVDLMTAVNNDVGATAIFSLFLWGSVRMIQRGLTPIRLLWVGVSALLCYWTKNTVMIAVPVVIVALVFSAFRGTWRWIAWLGLSAAGMAAVFTVFSWGDAALWYRQTPQPVPTRVQLSGLPERRYAIQLVTLSAPASRPAVFQILPPSLQASLRGTAVTLGAWIWASQPVHITSPMYVADRAYAKEIDIGTTPVFYSVSFVVSQDARIARVTLQGTDNENAKVFFNGLVLVEGQRPLDESPEFDDAEGKEGVWGGAPFVNLLRNGTAESSWPYVSPWIEVWVEELVGKHMYFSTRGSLVLGSLLDLDSSSWYYVETSKNLVRTFWAKFGWGHVPLSSVWYWILGFISLAGIGGSGIALWRQRRSLPWAVLSFLAATLGIVWGDAAVRGSQSLITEVFTPGARYAYPAIIPTLIVLNAGWIEIARIPRESFHLSDKMQWIVFIIFFLGLDLLALLTLINYYYVGG